MITSMLLCNYAKEELKMIINIVNFVNKYPAKFVIFLYVFALNFVVFIVFRENTIKVNYFNIFLFLCSNAMAIRYCLIDFIRYIKSK